MKPLKFVFLILFLTVNANASVEVLFHPTDPTLPKIAAWITEAKQTIDISMYDLDTSDKSPVILALLDPAVQSRLASGQLSLRFIYEGYGTPAQRSQKMTQLENLGADVRFVTSSKKVHHKIAIFDAGLSESRVVTGSANWSTFSFYNYDENILFMQNESAATANYENEFELLWNHSTEFGKTLSHPPTIPTSPAPSTDDIQIYFNSGRLILKDLSPEFNLTSHIVKLIDGAKTQIQIATTRVRIISILQSLQAAAQRGVKIQIIISLDDYHDLGPRAKWLLGQPNLELRIKFYNLDPGQFLDFQMHNKFMIVDQQTLLTGSFNWSNSSENSFLENLIILKGQTALQVMPNYLQRFDLIWQRGRDTLPTLQNQLIYDHDNNLVPICSFPAISLTYAEARSILKLAPKCLSAR